MTHLPMATRFRQLKETYKKSVGVYRSNIHKRGLFCHRDIEAMEMVIEYAGEVTYNFVSYYYPSLILHHFPPFKPVDSITFIVCGT